MSALQIADLRQPLGVGDKLILRQAAAMLGLDAAKGLVKRAIHFGSRIAKQNNVRCFGSNRSASGSHAYEGGGGGSKK